MLHKRVNSYKSQLDMLKNVITKLKYTNNSTPLVEQMLEMKIKFDDLTIQFNGQANLLKASNTTMSQIKTDNENLVSSLKNDHKLALCEQKRNSATCKTQLETELKKSQRSSSLA